MKIAIVGAEMHGIEAVYLAKKAGFETLVIGKREGAPALSLADEYAVVDPMTQESAAMRMIKGCDAVLPACENVRMLTRLAELLSRTGIPFLFDIDAFLVSSSKNASNALMEKLGMPMPRRWQECGFPVIVKPSSHSGGAGVTVANSVKEVNDGIFRVMEMGDEPLIQEYVSGRCVSVDVIGDGRKFRSLTVTEGMFDKDHDCKRVRCAPGILNDEKEKEIRRIAETLAESMDLRSVMSVEAIDSADGLKIMEMDARIPTQAPSAVLAATGTNLLNAMMRGVRGIAKETRASSYEHFVINGERMRVCGEREFAKVRDPRIEKGLFGADEMITDHEPGAAAWRCAMINSAATDAELEKKRIACIASIMKECGIRVFVDASPAPAAQSAVNDGDPCRAPFFTR